MARSQFNYYRTGARKEAGSPFKKKEPKAKRAWSEKLVDWMIFAAVVVALVYSLLVNSSPKVVSESWPYHAQAVYAQAVRHYLDNLQDKTKLTFNQSKLAQQLAKQFPEISDVSVEIPLISEQPVIRLAIADPQFVLTSNSKNYILDSQGVIVGLASDFKGLKELPTLNDQSGIGDIPGHRILSSSEVAFINEVLTQSKRAEVNISSAILPPQAQELDIKTADQPYQVKFYLGGDAAIQTGQFLAARHQFAKSTDAPQQYLDVRVKGKIYYK